LYRLFARRGLQPPDLGIILHVVTRLKPVNAPSSGLETLIGRSPIDRLRANFLPKLQRIGLMRQIFCEIRTCSCIAATLVTRSKLNRAIKGCRRL
jgi:hypothetical protein